MYANFCPEDHARHKNCQQFCCLSSMRVQGGEDVDQWFTKFLAVRLLLLNLVYGAPRSQCQTRVGKTDVTHLRKG